MSNNVKGRGETFKSGLSFKNWEIVYYFYRKLHQMEPEKKKLGDLSIS